ncbi:MAG: MarR family winged helix-turn-helix transcriptional regulator [Candidatus Promineifilaceae bacterium]
MLYFSAEMTPPTHINFSYLPTIVGHLSGLLHIRATQIAVEMLEPLALTTKQFSALEFVSNNPHLSQKEIAHYIGTTAPMMVHVLDSLAKRNLIKRVRSETDRRKQHIHLTDAGLALLDEIKERALEADRILLEGAGISAEEKTTLLKLLQRLTDRVIDEE